MGFSYCVVLNCKTFKKHLCFDTPSFFVRPDSSSFRLNNPLCFFQDEENILDLKKKDLV